MSINCIERCVSSNCLYVLCVLLGINGNKICPKVTQNIENIFGYAPLGRREFYCPRYEPIRIKREANYAKLILKY